jgi:ABC-type Zn uptake system ZnuABC Zn-binding protein ZnuA
MSRASAYIGQLRALDAEIRQKVATIPAGRRKLVTSHDAFPYYAKAYGLEIVGFTQTEEGKEPSAGELAELVRTVRAANVPAVFVEAGVSPRIADALAKEAGVSRVVTDLPSDSLGDKPADTFLGVMRVVTDKIVGALR